MSRGNRGLIPFFTGQSSVYTTTSSYVTFAEAPGTARNLVFEIYLSASTSLIDFRLVQGMPRLEAATSNIRYLFPATTYGVNSSSFTIRTGKGAYSYALQARLSTSSTAATTIQAKWMGIS